MRVEDVNSQGQLCINRTGTRGLLLTKLLTALWPSNRTGRGFCHKSKQQMEKDEKDQGRFSKIYNVGNIQRLSTWKQGL